MKRFSCLQILSVATFLSLPGCSRTETLPVAAASAHAAGTEASYALSYDSDSSLQPPDSGANPPAHPVHFVTRLRGALVATVVADEGDRILVLYRSRDARAAIEIDGVSADADAAQVATALHQGFLVRRDRAGKILALHLPKVTVPALRFLRSLAAWTQVTLPEVPSASWQVTETATSGKALASYALDSNAARWRGQVPIRKTIRANGATEGPFEGTRKATTTVEIALAADAGVPGLITGEEHVEQGLSGKALASSTSHFKAELTGTRVLGAPEIEVLRRETQPLRAVAATMIDTVDADPGQKTAVENERLAGASLPALLTQLRAEESGASNHDASLFFKLRAYAFLHPEDCEKLGAALLEAPSKGATADALVAALAGAGSREAQRALASVLKKRASDDSAVMSILTALGTTERPSAESVAAVEELRVGSPSADAVSTAALTLGSMAHALAVVDPALADRIVDAELARLAASKNDAEKIDASLGMLGNAGSPRALRPLLLLAAGSAPPKVRRQALWALRTVPQAEAEKRIVEALVSDPDPEVRTRAAEALYYRDPSDAACAAAKARLVLDPSPTARLALVRLLIQRYAGRADVSALLDERAKKDPEESVRRAASERR